ncbi:hypothetical protein P3T73_14930 [Kiritimatiellota bacterium B12222]|nr:hypothetical protein P3T73_14930 [Kiritimatiellota bacterium B12222]
MTVAGWMVMGFTVIGVISLLSWSIWKVISTPNSTEHLHGTMDIDPEDD